MLENLGQAVKWLNTKVSSPAARRSVACPACLAPRWAGGACRGGPRRMAHGGSYTPRRSCTRRNPPCDHRRVPLPWRHDPRPGRSTAACATARRALTPAAHLPRTCSSRHAGALGRHRLPWHLRGRPQADPRPPLDADPPLPGARLHHPPATPTPVPPVVPLDPKLPVLVFRPTPTQARRARVRTRTHTSPRAARRVCRPPRAALLAHGTHGMERCKTWRLMASRARRACWRGAART